MKYILMNQNTEVLIAEYNTVLKGFSELNEIKNVDYAPVIIKKLYQNNKNDNAILEQLTEWFKGRGIPSLRDDLDLLLAKLNVTTAEELLDKAFGLSLSDQYWIKPYGSNVEYKDIKRFDISKLDGVVEEFEDLLHKYQNITHMTDRRINKICNLLFSRITKLKRYIVEAN